MSRKSLPHNRELTPGVSAYVTKFLDENGVLTDANVKVHGRVVIAAADTDAFLEEITQVFNRYTF